MQLTVIISRSHDSGTPRVEFEDSLAKRCSEELACSVLLTPPLYHIPEDSSIWKDLAAISGHVVFVSSLHPRPAEWLLKKRGVGGDGLTAVSTANCYDDGKCFAAVANSVAKGELPVNCELKGELSEPFSQHMTVERWYPVVDLDKCTHCGHCLQFCLFGVYESDADGQVVVTNPDKCKPGCPACSRICPQGAIMFPLYRNDEAIAGADGKLMSPDLAAKKMFYTRTKRSCPVCGNDGSAPAASGALCQECGRPVPGQNETASEIRFDDIDALIDDLDNLGRRSS